MTVIADMQARFAQAKAAAERMVGRVLDQVPAIANLRDALEVSAEVETNLRSMADVLKELDRAGYATSADFTSYNRLQTNLQQVQGRLLPIVRRLLAHRPDVLRQIPVKVTKAGKLYPEGYSAPQGNLQGLGTPSAAPVAVPGALAGLAPWMICAIILAALAAAALLVWAVAQTAGLVVEALRDILVTKFTTDAQKAVIEARVRIYEDCVNRGGDSVTCSNTAKSTVDSYIPPELPRLGGWIPWVAGAVITLAVLGTGIWLYYQLKTPAKALSGANYKRLSARNFHRESYEDDGLEV